MEIKITKEENSFLVVPTGRLDTTTAPAFQEEIAPLLAAKGASVEVDCSGLEYTSSQGLRLFLMLQKGVAAEGGKLVLTNMKPQVREVFDMTGFSKIIEIK